MRISPIQTQQTDNTSRAKKAAAGLAATAAVTGGLVYLAKTGKLDKNEGGNLIKESAKTLLRTPAEFLAKQADKVADSAGKFVAKHPKLDEKLTNFKTFVTTKYNSAKTVVNNAIDTVKSKFAKKTETTASNDTVIA